MKRISKDFNPNNKRSVENLHKVLVFLDDSGKSKKKKAVRKMDSATRKLVKAICGGKVNKDGKLTAKQIQVINEILTVKKYSDKANLAKLEVNLHKLAKRGLLKVNPGKGNEDPAPSLEDFIRCFQKKYKLKVTGRMDADTDEKLESVLSSVAGTHRPPKKMLKVKNPATLQRTVRFLRLNMCSDKVANLQRGLAFLGYKIHAEEHAKKTYGKTTRNAVLKFQTEHGLPPTGDVDSNTAKGINHLLARSNPAVKAGGKFRVRGSVRDELWQGKKGATVEVYELGLRGNGTLLGKRKTFANGFFDILFAPPFDPAKQKPKSPLHLVVKVLDSKGEVQESKTYYNVKKVHWANFTEGGDRYQGTAEFSARLRLLEPKLRENNLQIEEIEQSQRHQDVTALARETGMLPESLLKLSLAHRIARNAGQINTLPPDLFYAFIRQNLPPEIPGDLFPDEPEEWDTWIAGLEESLTNGIVFLDAEIQEEAVKKAFELNYIPRQLKPKEADMLQALQDLRNSYVLEKPLLIGEGNLGSILEISTVPRGKYSAVADSFTHHQGINLPFWENLGQETGLSESEIKDFHTTVELGVIARNYFPTVNALKALIDNSAQESSRNAVQDLDSARDLARLNTGEWSQLIVELGDDIPSNIDGSTLEERRNNWAATMQSQAEKLHPSVAFVAEVDRQHDHGLSFTADVAGFVYQEADFDLGLDDLVKYNQENGNILNAEAMEEAKVMQRIHRIAPSALAGVALLNENLHSSMQIYFRGKDQLTEVMKGRGIGELETANIYRYAESQYAQVLAKITQYRFDFVKGNAAALPNYTYSKQEIQGFLSDIPNIETLFGSLDYCECKHCRSVCSPAAYLTDLFRFLDEKQSLELGSTVKDIFFARRPDLGNIKLNCENTHTPLPYIDLVNEILENAVAPVQSDFVHQTTLTAAELRAMPEHRRPLAYNVLRSSTFPMNMNFNLWQSETRMFLDHLGVPRHALMQAFQDASNPAAKDPQEVDISAEYFSISTQVQALITAQTHATQALQEEYWGTADVALTEFPVDLFLEKTKINYTQLLDLLQCTWINPGPNSTVINRPVDDCDLEVQFLDNMSLAKFDRIHRFLRMWRHMDWEMWELDLALRNGLVGDGLLDENALGRLMAFDELRQRLSLDIDALLAFIGPLNTEIRFAADASEKPILPLYHQLFLNVAISNPVDSNFELPLGGGPLTPHESNVLSALSLSADALALLIPLTTGTLSLDALSVIYRYATLARQLRLSVQELLKLQELTGIADPFAGLDQTATLIAFHDAIKAAGFSILELEYTLLPAPDSPMGLREEVYLQYMESLRTSLVALEDSMNSANDTDRERMERNLVKIPVFSGEATLEKALDLIEGIWSGTEPERLTFIDGYFGYFIPASADPQLVLTKESYYEDDPMTPMVDETGILTPAEETAIIGRYAFVMGFLYTYLSVELIKEQVASAMGFSNMESDVLLTMLQLPGSGVPLLEELQVVPFTAREPDGSFSNDLTEANFPNIFQTYWLLHKISILLRNFNLPPEALAWFIDHQSDLGILDLQALPTNFSPVSPLFPNWYRWWRFNSFYQSFPEPEDASFFDVLELGLDGSSPLAPIHDALAALTQWDMGNLGQIHLHIGLEHSAGTQDYAEPETYHRLWECMRQIRLTGVGPDTLQAWKDRNTQAAEQAIAESTRLAAKSKYDLAEWLRQVEPIQDELREMQRDALMAYHIEHALRNEQPSIPFNGDTVPNPAYWENAAGLFNYFLIDVEMNACQLTSRIKQAISSTQLFVQRCFLNLESRFVQVPNDDPDLENAWEQWRWMKNYRIWEANRKVFMYPENWIEPELRDDKSPFFKELENELKQNEITHEHVEEIFQNYLFKVDEVSRMEIMGLYHQVEGPTNVVHVIGRTPESPAVYHYRTYDMNYAYWTAWEKMDVEISGDHAIPYMYNRKLYVFWLVFNEKPIKIRKNPPAEPSSDVTDSEEPPRMLEIQLAWTMKKHTGWTGKTISRQKMIHPWQRPEYSYHLKPRYKASTNTLWVDLFLSTSEEFNDGNFYDQFAGRKVQFAKARFNETFRPWHSSSFVFDGKVQKLKLRGLRGFYSLPVKKTKLGKMRVTYVGTDTNSYAYVHSNFGRDGKLIEELRYFERAFRLKEPEGMHFEYNYLTNNQVHSQNSSLLNRTLGLGTGANYTLLKNATDPFRLIASMQDLQQRPFFYADQQRVMFVKYEWEDLLVDYQTQIGRYRFVFYPFYHAYSQYFLQELGRGGVDGLLTRNNQVNPPDTGFRFDDYSPKDPHEADPTGERDSVDFSFGGAYSIYNWEIFFHAPMLIANLLSQNQRFEEAMHWYHYIFDPTNTENLPVPQRYWITKPFYEHSANDYRVQRIGYIMDRINEFAEQVTAWKNDPFKPHLVARYRPVAYQRNVVMKYLDNLIAWGDQLFRRDTMESINEATLLYMLAYELLGERPVGVPSIPRQDRTFSELLAEGPLDIFGNTKVEVAIENELSLPIRAVASTGGEPMPRLEISYFCLPNNPKLEGYWDTIEDRLFKIRNCMNIEGIVRQLSLFAPPIDPALLVKAAAGGLDLGSVLNDLSVANPNYRFRPLLQAAVRFASEVKSLGDKLLRALEMKDAEGLALLRAGNEIKIQEAIKEVRKMQIDENEELVKGLESALQLATIRQDYYGNKEFMNGLEVASAALTGASILFDLLQIPGNVVAGMLHLIPNFSVGVAGFGGSPTVTVGFGGSNIASSASSFNAVLANVGSSLAKGAGLTRTIADYQRRKEDWDFNASLAAEEIEQVTRQIAAANIRVGMSEKELDNQELVIENRKSEEDYLKSKYTNEQLYNWMVSQVSSLYFQAYQLAYDMAKKTEKSFQRELGLSTSSYINFGYWDSLKKGLLSGDKLLHDLQRMESAFYDQHKREFELTKHVSLAQIAPWCLVQLKMTGSCTLDIPEWIFDMDYPGHYMRRIKSVSATIPAITGPYVGVHCTLSLLTNRVRTTNVVGASYAWQGVNDSRFAYEMGAIRSIATSSGQSDAGMFELNFADERFLPFEGSGVIGTWEIKMPKENNSFDFDTISDVVFHFQYTARSGGGNLEAAARTQVESILPQSGLRLLSAKHEFGTAWHRFLYPDIPNGDQELRLDLSEAHFPFYARGSNIAVTKVNLVLLEGQHAGDYNVEMTLPNQMAASSFAISRDSNLDDSHHREEALVPNPDGVGEWLIKIQRDTALPNDFASLPVDDLEDIVLVVHFSIS